MDKNFGFINIYKPVGMTSHDVVGYLRRITKIRQIGHAGTLDPFAEGVLPVAIGKSTRLIEYLSDDKAYTGRFCFGKSTDTYDIEGKILKVFETKIQKEDVADKLNLFKGNIEQIPPIYSAKKINGKKAYELARSGLGTADLSLKPCSIVIYDIKLLDFNYDEQWADIYISCSKGTYIRSVANDLGESLNNGCFLSKLKRVKSGLFEIDNSVLPDNIKTPDDVQKNLLNPVEYLPYSKIELDKKEYDRVIHGMTISDKTSSSGTVLLTFENKLTAVASSENNIIKVKKVFDV